MTLQEQLNCRLVTNFGGSELHTSEKGTFVFQHSYTWNILSLIVYRILSLLSCPEACFSNNGCYTIYGSGAVLLALRFFSCGVFYRTFTVCFLAPLLFMVIILEHLTCV